MVAVAHTMIPPLRRLPKMPAENVLPRISAGDPNAMDQCMDRYGGLVWSLARRWISDRTEAEEAVQEVFIAVWKAAERFDPELASEATFVTMIARRRLIDRQRRRSRIREVNTAAESFDELPGPEIEDTLGRSEEVSLAMEALSQLRPEQQLVLSMAIYEGLSHSEISSAIAIPLGTVKTHARRGLQRIRDLLDSPPASHSGEPSP